MTILSKEATFRHVFTAALAANTTSSTSSICPELCGIYAEVDGGKTPSINGEIDFYLSSNLRWGIGLLIRGNKIQNHMHRFADGGNYVSLKMRDWIVVDLRRDPLSYQVDRHYYKLSVFFY